MIITRENVVEYLKNGLVKTSMVYPITKQYHFIVLGELTIKLSNDEIIAPYLCEMNGLYFVHSLNFIFNF